ncbi:hypothetical protein SAMN04488137_0115 [Fictibacillus solisalsi]|uniref:Uncharacterized protein n=1 Tax=Fictibacillus solisalsi TaxID=459525 RepID=A0A1H0D0F0_9BACL|nr:hypothetical protein [Fictibacillus solisalsi]SDN63341.1 hypothetical protein SAMN04488137_0115 [Fictibacillus solisalsi]
MKISIKSVNVDAITMKGSLNIGKTLIIKRYSLQKEANQTKQVPGESQTQGPSSASKKLKVTPVQPDIDTIKKQSDEMAAQLLANACLLYYIAIMLVSNP